MLPAYLKKASTTTSMTQGVQKWEPSAGTKALVKERLTRMATEEGKTLEELEPRYKTPPLCPEQRAEIRMLIESRKQRVQRWIDETREREDIAGDPDAGDDAMSVYSDASSIDSALYDQVDEALPHSEEVV